MSADLVVIQLNAHLTAEHARSGGWQAQADLGLGLVTTHKGRTSRDAILGALGLALAELEVRHAS